MPKSLVDEIPIDVCEQILDPVTWITTVLDCKPWSKQIEIIRAVNEHRHVAVRSCHGVGKDWTAARIVLQFLHCNDPVRVITTGPTDRQVRGILWKEIAIAHKRAICDLEGKLLTQEYHISEDRFALGFTTSRSASTGSGGGSRFQGWHATNILVIIDEASGVDSDVYTEVSGVLSSANPHLLEIGNPTNPNGDFASSFKTPGVYKITISAFDTPNFTEFGISLDDIRNNTWREKITEDLPYPELITPEWVYERYRKWGENNPLFQSRVLAEFPAEGENTFIPLYLIEQAQALELMPSTPNVIAVDVARYGPDMTVIAHRRGAQIRIIKRIPKCDTMEVVGHTVQALRDTKADRAIVDVVGIGAGVVDRLRELRYRVVPASGGSSPRDGERYLNARAEWYGTLRDDLESGKVDLDPLDEDLCAQLSDIKWKPDSKGRIVLESKEDMKKRGVSSPDDADAAAMTYCLGIATPSITTLSDDGHTHSLYKKPDKKHRWY